MSFAAKKTQKQQQQKGRKHHNPLRHEECTETSLQFTLLYFDIVYTKVFVMGAATHGA